MARRTVTIPEGWIVPGMLTGRQLREARILLGLQPSKLAERMGIPRLTIKIAESVDGECPITIARARHVQAYLEAQGIEILPGDIGPAARLSGTGVPHM